MSIIAAQNQVRRHTPLKRAKAFSIEPNAKQLEILAFMREYLEENDGLPTSSEIAEYFGWRSNVTAQNQLSKLIQIGQLERTEAGRIRFARYRRGEQDDF